MTEHGGSGRGLADPAAALRFREPPATSSPDGLPQDHGADQKPDWHGGSASAWPKEGAPGTTAVPLRAVADEGAPAPDHADLRTLLAELKVTRRRRDDADVGSPEWRDADDDLRDLQHAIFLVGMDDPIQTRSPEHDSE
jgi:hypothetical protein